MELIWIMELIQIMKIYLTDTRFFLLALYHKRNWCNQSSIFIVHKPIRVLCMFPWVTNHKFHHWLRTNFSYYDYRDAELIGSQMEKLRDIQMIFESRLVIRTKAK